ncbi:MAG: hypothetical protein ACXWDI_02955 [Nocardioides sp.]
MALWAAGDEAVGRERGSGIGGGSARALPRSSLSSRWPCEPDDP